MGRCCCLLCRCEYVDARLEISVFFCRGTIRVVLPLVVIHISFVICTLDTAYGVAGILCKPIPR